MSDSSNTRPLQDSRTVRGMNHLTADEASRLAVTAVAADLEHWARTVAAHGQIDLDDLIGVLDVLRADSVPQHSAPSYATFAAN
jgi:hypothetical protein